MAHSSSSVASVTSVTGYSVHPTPRSTETELLDRIQRLERELKNKDETIHEQQNQLKYSGPKSLYYTEGPVFNPSGSPHHSGLQQQQQQQQQQQHSVGAFNQPVGVSLNHLDLCSSFSFDIVSVSLCPMHMYMHGKGRHACKCVGKCFDGISP